MGKLKNLKKLEKFLLCKRQSRAKAICFIDKYTTKKAIGYDF